MNSMQVKDKLKNISREKNIEFNILFRFYMCDRFIERLAKSKYKDNFILKGGFYLSTLFGVENRTTMDIDTSFRNADFSKSSLENMIKEIIEVDINDGTIIEFESISSIRDEDEYGGFRVNLIVKLEKSFNKIHIDIVTGDPITPKEIRYKYKPILGDDFIDLWAYYIETVIEEKLETILNRVELNGRMRDFYDIYLIYTRDWDNINKDNLRKAIEKTFSKRYYFGNPFETLDVIRDSNILKSKWKIYQRKYEYAEDIEYEKIIYCIEKVINVIISEYA